MAIVTDYTSLLQAVADYLDRAELVSFIPNMVQSCESTLYKTLRIRAMENAMSVTTASGVAAVPTSPAYVELKFAYVNSTPVTPLTRVLPEQIYELSPNRGTTTSTPLYISHEATDFTFSPYPVDGTVVKGIYYGRLDPLSGVNLTNWFTDNAPELLLYGALLEAQPFLGADPRMAVWLALYQRAYASVESEEKRQKLSGGKLVARKT